MRGANTCVPLARATKPAVPKVSANAQDGTIEQASPSGAAPVAPASEARSQLHSHAPSGTTKVLSFRKVLISVEKNRLLNNTQQLVKVEMDRRTADLVKFSRNRRLNNASWKLSYLFCRRTRIRRSLYVTLSTPRRVLSVPSLPLSPWSPPRAARHRPPRCPQQKRALSLLRFDQVSIVCGRSTRRGRTVKYVDEILCVLRRVHRLHRRTSVVIHNG